MENRRDRNEEETQPISGPIELRLVLEPGSEVDTNARCRIELSESGRLDFTVWSFYLLLTFWPSQTASE